MRPLWIHAVCLAVISGGLHAQEPAPPIEPPDATEPEGRVSVPSDAGALEADPRTTVGSTPGARTVSLGEAVTLALVGNFGIRNSIDGLQSAEINVSTAQAEFRPRVTPLLRGHADDRTFSFDASQKLPWTGGRLSASASYRANDREDAIFPRTSDLRLTLTQPVLRGFGPTVTKFDLTNSRRALQGRERAFERARQRLAVDVTAGFYQVIKQRRLLAVAQQSRERSLRLKVASEARLKVGLASKLDVLRAELQASQAESAAVSSQSALETALEQFRFLLGLAPSSAVEPEDVALPDTLPGDVEPFEVLLARAYASRLDLRESIDEVEDARRSLAVARQQLLPQVDVNVGVTRTGYGTDFTETFEDADSRVDFFFTASYPLERTAARAAKANAQLDLGARERLLQQKRLEVETDVRSAVRELERLRKSVELQRKGVEFADQQHRLATLRYERGLASNFDVVDAEQNLFSARTALVGLLTDYQVARVRLLRETGELDVEMEFGP